MSDSSIIKFDRSRIVAYQKCPRLRYFQYEWQGTGLQATMRYLPLEAGGAIHKGLEWMLQGHDVDHCVKLALETYDMAVVVSGVDLTLYEGQDPARVVAEHRAIVEALLRTFHRTELPALLHEYEVIAIEQELSKDYTLDEGTKLRLLARIDILLKRKVDGALFILNFKTASMTGKKWVQEWQHDMQVISEVEAASERYGSISGVLIYGLVKGQRKEYPVGSGNWYHNTPLCWGWHRAGTSPTGGDEWATRYETDGKRLGKGFRKVSTWDNYPGGLKGWLRFVELTDPELLKEQFVLLPAITRTTEDVGEWQMSTLPREADIHKAAGVIAEYEKRALEPGNTTAVQYGLRVLNSEFPKHTAGGNCVWPSRCMAYELCWGGAAADPLNSGYEVRQPNHPAENEEVVANGGE